MSTLFLSLRVVVIAFVCLATSASAQEQRVLKGKVVPKDRAEYPPSGWTNVTISVWNQNANKLWDGAEPLSTNQYWSHVAPQNARVDVHFQYACYVPGVQPDVIVDGNKELPMVKLEERKSCIIARRRKEPRAAGASRPTAMPAMGGTASMKEMGEVMSAGQWVSTSPPSANELATQLEKEAAIARKTNEIELFVYNFEADALVYNGDPELNSVITQFRKNNQDLFAKASTSRFDDVIKAQFAMPGEVNPMNIFEVVKDDSIPSSIRGSATVALQNIPLEKALKQQALSYFRAEAIKQHSQIPLTVTIALALKGEAADKRLLYQWARTAYDKERQATTIDAISLAWSVEPNSFPDAVNTLTGVISENTDPYIEATAIRSLRPFALQRSKIALQTLIAQLKKKNNDESARSSAAMVLGAGTLESEPKVRAALNFARRYDASPLVRNIARLALTSHF